MKTLLLTILLAISSFAQSQTSYYVVLADDVSPNYLYDATLAPNLARMAKEGIRYQNAWATPKCSPTRASLLTGYRPKNHGVTDNMRRTTIPASATLPRVVKEQGYATGVFGKWNTAWQVEDCDWDRSVLWNPGDRNTGLHSMEDSVTGARFYNPSYTIDGTMQNGQGKFGPHVFEQEAVSFMNNVYSAGPFLVYHSMVLGHGDRSHKYPRPPGRTGGDAYSSHVREIDAIVGRVMAEIKMTGRTDIRLVFASDNPTAREGKSQKTYRGCRTAIIAWGGGIPARGDSMKAVQLRDLYTTITRRFVRDSIPLFGGRTRRHNVTDFQGHSMARKGNAWAVCRTGATSWKDVTVYRVTTGKRLPERRYRNTRFLKILRHGQ